MIWTPVLEMLLRSVIHTQPERSLLPTSLDALQKLRPVGVALYQQAALLVQLTKVEWAQEKQRLQRLLLTSLLGFACLLCLMLCSGVLLLTLSWNTDYRIQALVALLLMYGLGLCIAGYNLHRLLSRSTASFAATRAELAADVALIKGKL